MKSIFARTPCILYITSIIVPSCTKKNILGERSLSMGIAAGQRTVVKPHRHSRPRTVFYSLLLLHRDESKSVDPARGSGGWGRCVTYDTLTKVLHGSKRRYKAPAMTVRPQFVDRCLATEIFTHSSLVLAPQFICFFRVYRSRLSLVITTLAREFNPAFAVKLLYIDASSFALAGFHNDRSTRRVANSEYYASFHVFRVYRCYLYNVIAGYLRLLSLRHIRLNILSMSKYVHARAIMPSAAPAFIQRFYTERHDTFTEFFSHTKAIKLYCLNDNITIT